MSVTDEIKARIDIVAYVRRFVPTLQKAGRNHKACCPFHAEKTPSFVVNPERQTWHCFGACGEGGDIFTFAQKAQNWDFKEALRELAHEAGVQLRQRSPQEQSRDNQLERLRGLLSSAAEIYHRNLLRPGSRAVLDYAREKRGFSMETVESFHIGFAPDSWDFALHSLLAMGYSEEEIVEAGLAARGEKGHVYDRFRNRLMIPIRDERGRIVGFGGRALNADDAAKYINSPQSALFDKSRLLYGLDKAKAAIRETGAAVVVEGYMDVMQAHQAGYRNVVAQMGTAMTEAQMRRVVPRYAGRLVMALDADEAGQSATRRSLDVARQTLERDYAGRLSVDIRVLRVPSGKDPDDFLRESPREWDGLVSEAQSLADFVIDMETAELPDGASMQDRQRAAAGILPILLASEDNLYQKENLQKLARRLRVSERELLAWAQSRANAAEYAGGRKGTSRPQSALGMDGPPPEYWGDDYDSVPPELESGYDGSPLSEEARQLAIEPYCLGLLLKHPHLLVQVNRRLRELAENDQNLLEGPLRDLGAEDFSQSQYRIVMARLQEAMAQDDEEPLDYVAGALDGELQADYRSLLADDPAALEALMNDAFQVDMRDIRRRWPGPLMSGARLREELVGRALRLRWERLERERVEMQYLQEEAEPDVQYDQEQRDRLNQQIMLSMTAKAKIDMAID